MKVGIITMHKVMNFGSALQAFATQRVIESLGHDAKLIDYQYPNDFQIANGIPMPLRPMPESIYYDSKKNNFKPWYRPNLVRLMQIIYWYTKSYFSKNMMGVQQIVCYNKFYHKYFNTTRKYYNYKDLKIDVPEFDAYVTGSDQVWNSRFTKGDLNFFLGFLGDRKKLRVAYSASFGHVSLETVNLSEVTPLLKKYDYISVREQNGANLIKEIIEKDCPVTLDPTLLLNKREWQSFSEKIPIDEDYILLYCLDYAFDPSPTIYQAAEYYRKKFGYKVVCIDKKPDDNYLKDYYIIYNTSPLLMLSYFSNASMVITSSFHGTAFAVNFGKPLIAVVPSSKDDDRQRSLLEKLNLNGCIASVDTKIEELNPFYNFNTEQDDLEKLRQDSITYLKTSLCYA